MSRRRPPRVAGAKWECTVECCGGTVATLVDMGRPSTAAEDADMRRLVVKAGGADPGPSFRHNAGGVGVKLGGAWREGQLRAQPRREYLTEAGRDGLLRFRFRCQRCGTDTGRMDTAAFQAAGDELRRAGERRVALERFTMLVSNSQ